MSTHPFHESDRVAVEPADRTNWYHVIAIGPEEDRLTVHETRDLAEANAFAARLDGIVRDWQQVGSWGRTGVVLTIDVDDVDELAEALDAAADAIADSHDVTETGREALDELRRTIQGADRLARYRRSR